MKIQEIKKDIAIRKEYMKNHNFEQVIESYYALSKNYFQNFIATCKDKKKNSHFSMYDYRRFFEKFTKRFPVVFSTTHSLKNCSGEHFLYDYLIIDEASQVDLVTACIAFSCAEKVILVGDEMQLKHIVRESDAKHLQTVFAQYFLNNNFEYTKNSIIRSVSLMYKNQAPSVLLKEHYRCDPQIIGFCNKRFYDDQLVVRTAHKKGNGIEIILTESIHARGRTNPRQIEIIDREIIPKLRNEDIGIIAPYRDQVQLLENRFDNIVKTIDTVHKFQGKENDTVILSTVANKIKFYDDEEKNDFLNDPNLLNVAFSRAKNKLIVVASKELLYQENTTLSDFSKYLNYYCSDAIIQNTKVYSVFDLMFDEYNEILEELKVKMLKISKFDSENIIGTVIKDICQSKSFSMFDFKFNYPLKYVVDVSAISDKEDFAFANNRLTHCDFLIYHKLDKSVKLIVEVDGRQHKESTQAKRDARKDHIIKNAGYKILRLTTDTVACKEKIEKALSEG